MSAVPLRDCALLAFDVASAAAHFCRFRSLPGSADDDADVSKLDEDDDIDDCDALLRGIVVSLLAPLLLLLLLLWLSLLAGDFPLA